MKKLFSSQDPLVIRSLEASLQSKGFVVRVQGEERLSSSGGTAPTEAYVDLILLNDNEEKEAKKCVTEFLRATPSGRFWTCSKCGEEIPEQFTDCWKCHSAGETLEAVIDPRVQYLKKCLRALVLIEVLLFIIQSYLNQYSYAHLPLALKEIAQNSYNDSIWNLPYVALIFFLLCTVSWVGLLLFWRPARAILLGLWVFRILATLSCGVIMASGPMTSIDTLSTLVGGAILALAYLSPLKEVFKKEKKTVGGNDSGAVV